MNKITNKVYSDNDGRSFDHLKDKNGQFKLDDVAKFLSKSASALAHTLNKLATIGESRNYNDPSFLTEQNPAKVNYTQPMKTADHTNAIGVQAAQRNPVDVVTSHAPKYTMTNVDDQKPQDNANTVYGMPKSASVLRKAASDVGNIFEATGKGAALGAVIGAGVGGVSDSDILRGITVGGPKGALIGGTVGLVSAATLCALARARKRRNPFYGVINR